MPSSFPLVPPTALLDQASTSTIEIPLAPIKKSTRLSKTLAYLQDYSHASTSLPTFGGPYDIAHSLTYAHLVPSYQSYVLAVSSNPQEPQSFFQAAKDPLWRKAMDKEIQALEQNHTWELISLPLGKTPIGCKWVYRIKLKSDGTVDRYKARLVAKGYTQREGFDFIETFSPVAKTVSVRVILALAVARSWPLHQLDINNAFLHGDLVEEVYMSLPSSFHSKGGCLTSASSSTPTVCKLVKSLYGLRQASRQWSTKVSSTIQQLGFIQSQVDHSLFVYAKGPLFTALLAYVDDMVITGIDPSYVVTLKSVLDAKFGIKDLG